MINKRFIFSKLLNFIFISDLLAKYGSRQILIVLAYHRIYDKEKEFLFDDEVISATPENFEKQLKFIKRYFSVITMTELYQYCICGIDLPKNPVMITFDDGYRDNYYNAFKLLQKYNLKATFFISTDYVESRDMFWWDKVAYIVKSSKIGSIKLSYPYKMEYDIRTIDTKLRAIKELLKVIKTTYNFDLKLFIHELASSAKTYLDDSDYISYETILSWAEIKEMKQAGMDIGSHTKTHRVLSNLTEDDLFEELSGSKNILEYHLSQPICSISYPVGGSNSFNQKVQESVERCGYSLAFSYGTGMNRFGITIDPFNIKRVGVDAIPISYLKLIMTMPSIYNF